MLVVREDCQRDLHPLTISHGYNSLRPRARFWEEFDWTGTDDPTPWLTAPDAIQFGAGLYPGGWSELRARNRALALHARTLLSDSLEAPTIAPDSMIGSLCAVPLPDRHAAGPDPLQDLLFDNHRIEVPIFAWPAAPKRLVRIAAAAYNREQDYRALTTALARELAAAQSAV
jgi:isopenicillin-N epimerase